MVDHQELPDNVVQLLQQKTHQGDIIYQSMIQSCEVVKSAQHQVWIVLLRETKKQKAEDDDDATRTVDDSSDDHWTAGLLRGNHRLVVRVWKGKSRWWNLNHHCQINDRATAKGDNDDDIARHELWGYQVAKQTFDDDEKINGCNSSRLRIPAILYNGTSKERGIDSFAIMEYVGKESTLFSKSIIMETHWTDGMIKIRHEFGFPEPHPRWGRVPVDQALQYAMQVLQEVVLPLHTYCWHHHHIISLALPPLSPVYHFQDLVALHQRMFSTVIGPYFNKINGHVQMQCAVDRLQSALQNTTGRQTPDSNISPVLVHMDLQPQNIIIGRRPTTDHHQNNQNDQQYRSMIVSVLDWEEAAWADPRFELLMLGRKVCANPQQANAIWEYYQEQTGLKLGSLDIWLRLETMHSLTTLLLQAATGTGRSPWETTPDLQGKIEREMARLDVYDERHQLLRR